MKKLTLTLDALRVESFDTGKTADHRGTVRAHATTYSFDAVWPTCNADTCDDRTCG